MTGPPGGLHGLPIYPTSFVGRAAERTEIAALLRPGRLVTLTGTPGCGKTRLAMEVVGKASPDFPDGIWWCDLTPVTDPAHVGPSLLSAFSLTESPELPAVQTLAAGLAGRRALLVLDNCEHLLSTCAGVTADLLARCPSLVALATSLQPLGIPGEVVRTVASLRPSDVGSLDPEAEAERLFVDRARLVLPSFDPSPAEASTVSAICRRLDGLPLAIELAAARVKMLTVEQIDARLEDALSLLMRSEFDPTPRHRTLRGTLDWTYRLLDGPERSMLRQLSVFPGSFSLDVVEVVWDGFATDAAPTSLAGPSPSALELLEGLAAKSLLQILPRHGESVARYRLPEVIRQYARAALEDSGEAPAARTRHLDWVLALAEESDAAWVGPDRAVWLDRLDLAHDDVRAALRWARTSRQVSPALQLVKAAWRYWFTRGHWSEGRAWSEEFLALDAELGHKASPELRADVLYRAGTFAYRHYDFLAAVRHLEESVDLFRAAHPKGISGSLNVLAMIAQLSGNRARAVELYEEALAISRSRDDRWDIGVTLVNLGGCLREQGDYTRAAQCFEELTGFADLADLAGHAASQTGAMAAAMGDYEASRDRLESALRTFERLGDQDTLAEVFEELGRLALNHGELALADGWMRESLAASEAVGSSSRIANATTGLAHVARERREFAEAENLYRQSLRRSQAVADPLGTGHALQGLGLLALAGGEPAVAVERLEQAVDRLRASGRPPDVVAALEDLACALTALGQSAYAGRLLAAAGAWRSVKGTPAPPLSRPRIDQAAAEIRRLLGGAEFTVTQSVDSLGDIDTLMVEVEPHEPPAARRAPVWRAHAFGPSHVFVDDRPLSDREWTYAKAKELFFYLLLHPTSTKARIGLDLWPDASPAQLRSAFHRTMHHLRRALGSSESVSFDGEAYSLNLSLPHASDLEDFERHLGEAQRHLRSGVGPAARRLAAEEIEQALALDRGDFLEDLDAGDWTILPREDLRRRSLEARLDLGELYFSDAQYARAADTYRRVIRIDPYLETAHRELIRCLARLGEIGQAVKHFEDLRRRLRLELNTRPAAETAFLVERLRRGDDV